MSDPASKKDASEEVVLARESLPLEADPFAPDPFAPSPFDMDPFGMGEMPLPPDNEFGDGVRDPIDYNKVPGIKGFGGWTKSHHHGVYASVAGDIPELWPGASIVEKE